MRLSIFKLRTASSFCVGLYNTLKSIDIW